MTNQANQLDHKAQEFVRGSLGVSDIQVISLAGDASSRRYSRIVAGESSYVLMIWEPFVDDGRYPFLNVLSHFAKHGVLVPKVIAKAPKLGLVLLEDLGDLTLERKFWENQNQELAMPYYKQSLDELIKMHYLATADSSADCVALKVTFNVEKLLWEMNYGLEHLIQKFCKINISAAVKLELQRIFTDICTILHEEPKYICHRDYHSRNIMLKHGKTRIIDFQDARTGPIQYDLVSLLHDSYVDLNEASRATLLDYYLLAARPHLSRPLNLEDFHKVFRIQMIQRCFKACGSFSSFYNTREDQRYLKYLTPTVKKVVDTLAPFSEYQTFTNLLLDNGLLEKDYLNPTELRA